MPTKLVTIKSTRKENFGEPVEVNAYYWTPVNKLLGVIFGHFAPFTGKYGHARMMYEAEKYGVKDFVVVMPPNKDEVDDNRNLFTNAQRIDIIKNGCAELGINILDCWVDEQKVPAAILGLIQRRFQDRRIIICCGPDRMKGYSKIAIPFDEDNEPTLDPADPNFRKQEMIVCADRGEQEVSGTAVRETLKSGDKESFKKMTGYSDRMWNMMRTFIQDNGIVNLEESFLDFYTRSRQIIKKQTRGISFEKYYNLSKMMEKLNEDIQDTPKFHIKHLYNPGNSQQLKADEFLDIIKWLKQQNCRLDDTKNVSYSEKCDGLPCRFGLDADGKFFLEQGKSGPIFDGEEFTNRDKERVGFATRINTAWKKVFNKISTNKTIMNILKKYNTESGIKVLGELFINSVASAGQTDDLIRYIGTEYYKSKMGTFCSFILVDVIDGEGNSITNANKLKNDLMKASSSEIMIDDTNYRNKFGTIDFNAEITELESAIKKLEIEFGNDANSILSNTSRKRDDLSKKKQLKALIEEYQGKFDKKIQALFAKTDGKWGPEREGIVLKLANNIMLKITSDSFKKFRADADLQDKLKKHKEWIFGPADED